MVAVGLTEPSPSAGRLAPPLIDTLPALVVVQFKEAVSPTVIVAGPMEKVSTVGGLAALQREIRYPVIARKAGIEGRVILQFIIDEQGRVTESKVVRGIGSGCEEEALRAFQTMRFRPGKQRGKPAEHKAPAAELPVLRPRPAPRAPLPTEPEEPTPVFVVVEEMPELIGGLAALQREIRYPVIARKAGIEGRVILQFIIDEQGRVTESKVVRGIGSGCEEEALRAFQTMRFRPGKQRGKPVKVKMSLPVTFRLSQ